MPSIAKYWAWHCMEGRPISSLLVFEVHYKLQQIADLLYSVISEVRPISEMLINPLRPLKSEASQKCPPMTAHNPFLLHNPIQL